MQRLTIKGKVADVNAALNELTYQGDANYNGSDTLTITTNDLGNTGSGGVKEDIDTVDLTVNAVNDAPINTVPNAQAVDEDTPLVFGSDNNNLIRVDDVDFNGQFSKQPFTNEVEVTASVERGTLSLASQDNLEVENDNSETVTLRGKTSDVRAALNGLTYQGDSNYNGSDTLTITTNDLGNTGSGGVKEDIDTVDLTVNAVNDAPINTVPNAQAVDEDTPLVFGSDNNNLIRVDDVDFNGQFSKQPFTNEVEVTASVERGTLSLASQDNLEVENDNSETVTLRGKTSDVRAALNGLTYQGDSNYNGSDTLTITTNDLGNTGKGEPLTDVDTVDIKINPVNDPPVNANVPDAQQLDEDTRLVFNTENGNFISISDIDVDGELNFEPVDLVQITLSVDRGKLNLNATKNLEIDNNGNDVVIVRGTVDSINTALNGLTYQSNANYNGSDTLTIEINDLNNGRVAGELFSTATVDLAVNAVNDVPLNTVPDAQAVDEDTPLVFNTENNNLITISDRDFNPQINQQPFTDEVEVTASVERGTIQLGSTENLEVANDDSATVTIKGKVAEIDAALNELTYQGDANYNGSDTLTITTNDLGNTGSGDSLTDIDTVDITVNAVNDAPVNTVPDAQEVDQNKKLFFNSANNNLLSVSDRDLDEGTGEAQITLGVEGGSLSLATIEGLNFDIGDGVSDREMTFTGSQTAINRALDGMFYQSERNFNGTEVLTLTTNDLGNLGDVVESDRDTLDITVIPDSDLDGIVDSIEAEIAEEIAATRDERDLDLLNQQVANEGSVVALYGDSQNAQKSIVIALADNPGLTISNVKTESLAEVTSDPIAVFDDSDIRKVSLQEIASELDVIDFALEPDSEIDEALQQQAEQRIQQEPVRVEIELPEDVEIDTILLRSADGTLIDFRRQSNPQRNELEYEMLTGAVLEDRNLDGLPDLAIVYLQDGAWGDIDGEVDGEITNSLVAANLDLGTSSIEVRESGDGLNFKGNKNYVKFSLEDFTSKRASEIGLAKVRFSESGQIVEVNGRAVDSPEEIKQTILQTGETLFNSLRDKRNPDFGTPTSTIAFEEGEQAVFFVVEGGTRDELLVDGLDSQPVFSLPSLNDGREIFEASSEDGQTVNLSLTDSFNIEAKIQTPEEIQSKLALLALNENSTENNLPAEIIDLNSAPAFEDRQVELQFSLQREADFDNSAYLYRVDDASGAIEDPLTGNKLDPTTALSPEQRYLELATGDRLIADTQFETSNFTTSEVSTTVAGGGYYAPLLVSDGTLTEIDGDFERVVTPYMEVNLDGADHIRSLGDGVYGFEDQIGGGDRDYNDMILSITQVEIMT